MQGRRWLRRNIAGPRNVVLRVWCVAHDVWGRLVHRAGLARMRSLADCNDSEMAGNDSDQSVANMMILILAVDSILHRVFLRFHM
jgi:hypothetical protein